MPINAVCNTHLNPAPNVRQMRSDLGMQGQQQCPCNGPVIDEWTRDEVASALLCPLHLAPATICALYIFDTYMLPHHSRRVRHLPAEENCISGGRLSRMPMTGLAMTGRGAATLLTGVATGACPTLGANPSRTGS